MIEAAQKIKEDGQQAEAGASNGDGAQEMVDCFRSATLPSHADLPQSIARCKPLLHGRSKLRKKGYELE